MATAARPATFRPRPAFTAFSGKSGPQRAAGCSLLAIDDLHWSDPDSLTAIHLLCRRLAALPVALIATTRPWPSGVVGSAQDLAAHGLAQIVPLAPLSTAAVREMLSARLSETAQAAWGATAYRCGDPDGLTAAARAAM